MNWNKTEFDLDFDLAVNETSAQNSPHRYVWQKPDYKTVCHLEEMRSKRKNEDSKAVAELTKIETEIRDGIKSLKTFRGLNRENKVSEIATLILGLAKSEKRKAINRDYINSFVVVESLRKKQEIAKSIIENLLDSKKIKAEKSVGYVYSYEPSQIGSIDHGSFAMLMKENGYKLKQVSNKLTIGDFEDFETMAPENTQEWLMKNGFENGEYETTEWKGGKQQKNQGCESFGDKSWSVKKYRSGTGKLLNSYVLE